MRCMSVARYLTGLGENVMIISADEGVRSFTESIPVHILGTDWSDMDSEIPALTDYLIKEDIHVLLVDSYSVTKSYFTKLKSAGIHVVYIDDLCSQGYPVDAVINYCPAAPNMGYEKLYSKETALYLGPAYMPLREQFREPGILTELVNDENREQTDPAKASPGRTDDRHGVFLTTGGADQLGLTDIILRRILEEIRFAKENEINADGSGQQTSVKTTENNKRYYYDKIHILAGRYYEPSEYVLESLETGSVVLHRNISDVASLMRQCRAAVSSAGSTVFELCAIGVPTCTFIFVDNQMTDAVYFDREGLMPYVGDFRVDPSGCAEGIVAFLKDIQTMSDSEYRDISRRLRGIVDGRGAERIADILVNV